ncbi:receptor-type tyrosine-protein phosphatase eta [Lepisosteus oculatus]|uniref:receptor-type tyrosine-protein phosphatase eta n=1 Tax=Lepisosteus oculatus TaxID=7918 RepID=UPI0035F51727
MTCKDDPKSNTIVTSNLFHIMGQLTLTKTIKLKLLVILMIVLPVSCDPCHPCVGDTVNITEIGTRTVKFHFTNGSCQINNGGESYNATSTEINGLYPGTPYAIQTNCSCCLNFTTRPDMIKNLTVTEVTTSTVSLSWTKPEGNSSFYRVQVVETGIESITNTTNITVTGLTAGSNYTFNVTALPADKLIEGSGVLISTFTMCLFFPNPLPALTGPDVIRNLTVTQVTTSSVSLNWTEPVGKSSYFRVEVLETGTNSTFSLTQSRENMTGKSFNIGNLTAGTGYTFTVIAVAADNSTAGAPVSLSQYTRPDVIRNLTVTQVTTSSVSLNWTEPVGKSSYFRVDVFETGTNSTFSLTQSRENMTEKSFNIGNLTAGTGYTFTVIAVAADNSTAGAPVSLSQYTSKTLPSFPNPLPALTGPDVIRNLTVTQVTTSSVSLNWTEPVGKSSYFRVDVFETGTNSTFSLTQSRENMTEKSFNIGNLTAGTGYTFTVIAVAADNSTAGAPVSLSQYTRPDVIRNLTVTQVTTSSVSLNWTEPVGKSSYFRVEVLETGTNSTFSLTQSRENMTEKSFNIGNLTAGTGYTFTVIAVAADNSTAGAPVSLSQYTRPDVIRNLTVTQVTTSSVSLNWTEPVGKSSYFRVEVLETGTNSTFSLTQSRENMTEKSFNIGNLTAGTGYTFTVIAVAADNSTAGAPVSLSQYTSKTLPSPDFPNPLPALTGPDVIRNLTVTQVTTSSVSLNWTEPVGKSSYFRVDVFETGTNSTFSLTQSRENMTEKSFNIGNLTAGTGYTFTVIAVAADNSTAGAPVSLSQYTRPDVIRNLTVTQVTTSSVSLNWTEPVGKSSYFRVEVLETGTNSTFYLTQSRENMTEKSFNIGNLTAGTGYTFTVIAMAADNSTAGAPVSLSQYTRPDVIRNLTVTQVTTSSVSLNWTEPVGKSSYFRVEVLETGTNSTFSLTQSRENMTEKSFNIGNLTAGTGYTFTVIAVAADNSTAGAPVSLSQYTRPDVIRNLTVTQVTTSSVSLNWTEPVGKSSYFRVEVLETGTNSTFSLTQSRENMTEKSFNIGNLTAGTGYTFTVIAVAADNSTAGAPVSLSQYTSKTLPSPDLFFPNPLPALTGPDVIRNLTVTQVTTSSVSLNWTEPVGKSSYFRVDVFETGTNSTFSLTQSRENMTEKSFNIGNLTAGTGYTFTVIAVAADNSTAGAPVSLSQYTRPDVIRNLTVTQVTTSSVSLNWTEPVGKSSYFRVEVLETGTNSTFSLTQSRENMTEKSFNIGNLTAGTGYTFTVIAVAADNSTAGAPVSLSQYTSKTLPSPDWFFPNPLPALTGPDVIRNLTVTQVTTSSVSLNWTEPVGKSSYFRVDVFETGTNSTFSLTQSRENMTEKSFNIGNLTAGTGYTFTVIAMAADNSTAGAPVSLSQYTSKTNLDKAEPTKVVGLTAQTLNSTAIKLTRNKSSDYKNGYSYVIQTFPNLTVQGIRQSSETTIIAQVSPGTKYTFQVFSEIQNKTTGGAETVSNYTNVASRAFVHVSLKSYWSAFWIFLLLPEKIKTSDIQVSSNGSTNSITVTWNPPAGKVESYNITIQGGSTITSNSRSVTFTNLAPGRIYNVTVTTISGPFHVDSDVVQNATYPTAPGDIEIKSKANDSMSIVWGEPPNMNNTPHSFFVTFLSASNNRASNNVTQNNTTLTSLQSGTQYIISVVTVGQMALQSVPVTTEVYTRPNPVQALTVTDITTNSVLLNWQRPDGYKEEYRYDVTVLNSSNTISVDNYTVRYENITVQLWTSGTNYTFNVKTLAKDGTESSAATVSAFTRPLPVGNLSVFTINTTAVVLTWTKPNEYKDGYTYLVETIGGPNTTVVNETAVITGLIPGTNYSFRVFTLAGGDSRAEPRTASNYTIPNKINSANISVSNNGTNQTIVVTWSPPQGNVENYIVSIRNSSGQVSQKNGNTSVSFEGLKAGTIYNVTVTTISGPFREESDVVQNATRPNTPGKIRIESKSNDSITLSWGTPPDMDSVPFSFYVKLQPDQNSSKYENQNNTILSGLKSGTSYNISVVTVGQLDFWSDPVIYNLVTTRPLSVESLTTASLTNGSVILTWNKPKDYKEGYQYRVTVQSNNGSLVSNETQTTESRTVMGLTQGASYTFNVTTLTSDNTSASPASVTSCTTAAVITDFMCGGPNGGPAILEMNWTCPVGLNTGFLVQVNGTENNLSTCTSSQKTFFNKTQLNYSTQYTVQIQTKGCGENSPPFISTCRTGITDPPPARTDIPVADFLDKSFDRFTVTFSQDLFNDSSGPITNYGILVTSALQGKPNKTDLSSTYSGSIKTYLATVIGATHRSRAAGSYSVIIGDGSKQYGYTNGPLSRIGQYRVAIVAFTKLQITDNLINQQTSLLSISPYSYIIVLPENPAVIGGAVGGTLSVFLILLLITIILVIYWRRRANKKSQDVPFTSLSNVVILFYFYANASVVFGNNGKLSLFRNCTEIPCFPLSRGIPVRVEAYETYYKKQRADSNCGFAEEFEDLRPVGTIQLKNHALEPDNKPKNRYNNVLPYDASRVKLSVQGNPCDDYINANYMPGYNSKKEFIAAQGPLPGTVNDFWRMIWEKNVHTLVMLTRCNEQGRVKCEEYWPSQTKVCSNITVTLTSEIPLEDWTIRDFKIKNTKTAETRNLRHFHFTAWPDHGVPETTELLISFRHLVREHMDQFSRNSPTIVHCSAGVGRTGTFIAIDTIIYQIEREGIVDVYGIVHSLRMHRPLMVQTEDQYVFLNQCAMDIIRSRTGTNVDLIYQNTAALSIYENFDPVKSKGKNGY